MKISEEERLAKQAEIRLRLQDLFDEDLLGTIGDLAGVSIAILAETYPPVLSSDDKLKIKYNYPEASGALIAERSMSKDGLAYAVSTAIYLARISIDYNPTSYCMDDIKKDQALTNGAHELLSQTVSLAFNKAVKDGMSAFGAASTLIHIGAMSAIENNVSWPVITRTLLEAIEHNMVKKGDVDLEQNKEEAIAYVMRQMNISRKTALKYYETAVKMKNNGEF